MNAFMRKATQILLGATLIYTGTLHLTSSRQEFQAQVPPWAPFTPDFIVLASGVVEIALGLALISLQRRKGSRNSHSCLLHRNLPRKHLSIRQRNRCLRIKR